MTPFATQAYNLLLQAALFNIVPTAPGSAVVSRLPAGKPEFIPERCFIVNTVSTADGFEADELSDFNGFIQNSNTYHALFGFPITRIKSFWDILNFYKIATANIGRIRIVTHASIAWMEFPMFPGGDFGIGTTAEHLAAYVDKDEEGLRWTLSQNRSKSPILEDFTNDIVSGVRKLNAPLLDPLKISAATTPLTGDTKLFMDIITDRYHLKFGAIVLEDPGANIFAAMLPTQRTQMNTDLDFIEDEIRKRLVGSTVGTSPNTNVVTAPQLDNIKNTILGYTPGQLELIGAKKALPADIMQPASTPGSLAEAMAASPKVEDDLRLAISGGTNTLMFSNRTGELLGALIAFNKSVLTLSAGNDITNWSDIAAVPDLEDFFFTCNDLYMMKHGEFEITGGNTITPAQRATIRAGIMAISDIVRKKITDAGNVSLNVLNNIRTAIDKLTLQQSQSTTGSITTMDPKTPKEFKVAVAGVKSGFRANLNKVRSLMKSTSFVDIRGCMIGKSPGMLELIRDFLGTGINKPTISAPIWWQSFPHGGFYKNASAPFAAYGVIDNYVLSGDTNIDPADVIKSFDLWKGLLNFDNHFTFISSLFDDTDAARFTFITLEWRTWQIGGAGAGIPVLNMEAERLDDLATLNLNALFDRFRIIFEIPPAGAVTAAQKTTLNGIQPHVVSYKTLKAEIIAIAAPTGTQVTDFYSRLGSLVTAISGTGGVTAPGTIQPAGTQNKANLDIYSANLERYIFTNLKALLDPFFALIRALLLHPNAAIRYYLNTGLVLPVQSSSHPTITNINVMMSYASGSDIKKLFFKAMKAWMKVQWRGPAVDMAILYARIDAMTAPSDLLSLTRRSVVSDGNPGGHPAGLDSHNCPTPDFHLKLAEKS